MGGRDFGGAGFDGGGALIRLCELLLVLGFVSKHTNRDH